MKFGRKYKLTIETEDGQLIIEPPLTIFFNIKRHILSSLNTATIEIYNLAENTRGKIFQDPFYIPANTQRHITLEAGYDTLSTIFKGTFLNANSVRSGVDIITTIDAIDGGTDTINNFTYRTLNANNKYEVLKDLIGSYATGRLTEGKVSNYFKEDLFQRPVVLEGNTYDLLKKYSDGKVFIDLEKIYILNDNEVIDGAIPLISAETGLLETPRRQENTIMLTTLFEPRIIMGQVIDLYSTVQKVYNGQYKVIGITHQGVISESVNGQCSSTIYLLDPNGFAKGIENVT